MTSLRMSFCLKAATELGDADLAAITDSIEASMAAGMDAKAAELLAVDDQLAALALERRELVQLIQAQHGGKLKGKPKAKAAAASEGLEDVGDNLAFNRRNFTGRGLSWDDLQGMNETMRVKNAVKAKVWPRPDYEAMVADGTKPLVARMLKQVYDGLSAGPKVVGQLKDADLERYVAAVAKVRDGAMALLADANFLAKLDAVPTAAMGTRYSIMDVMARDDAHKPVMEALLRKVWPEEYQGAMRPFSKGTLALAEARVIGGNKAIGAMQLTIQDVRAWAKDIADTGWPSKREAWQVQGLEVLEPGSWGAELVPARGSVTTPYWRISPNDSGRKSWRQPSEPDQSQFLLADANGSFNSLHASREDAVEAARARVAKKRDTVKVAQGTNIMDTTRQGEARREPGENITSDRLKETFGFRGVNFGGKGWMGEAERQAFLNSAFDAFHDLASIMGVPPKAMSLGGQLGVAFGAQGNGGKAAAHFVPGHNEINLTKTMGAGALAHEFGHALDHWFGVQAGLAKDKDPYLSAHPSRPAVIDRMELVDGKYERKQRPGYAETIRPEVVEYFAAIVKAMDKRAPTAAEVEQARAQSMARSEKNLKGWLAAARRAIEGGREVSDNGRQELLTLFDAEADDIGRGLIGEGYKQSGKSHYAPAVAKVRELIQKATGRLWSKDETDGLNSNAVHYRHLLNSKDAAAEHIPQRSTNYAADSAAMDKEKGGKEYWGTPWEKFARAFETWAHDRLVERGGVNTFLTNADDWSRSPAVIEDTSSAMARASGATRDLYLWPVGDERATMFKAFSAMVDGLKTREDDAGNVAFYSRGQGASGIRPSAVQAAVDRITQGWDNAPEVVVLGAMADAPQAVRDHDAKMRSQGAAGEPEGFFYKGKVYLNASQLGGQADVERVLFHETLGHFGLRGAFGKELESVLRQVIGGRRAEVEAKRKAYGLADTDAGRLVAAEEVLAELAQTKPQLGLVQRALAVIRRVLRKLGMELKLSDSELVQDFILPARAFVERGGKPGGQGAPAFSRGTMSAAFKRWFGDSKVVDADGKPMVVYHETSADFDAFDTERSQMGAHFGSAEQARGMARLGRGRAPRTIPAYLSIKRPLRLKDNGTFNVIGVAEQLVNLGVAQSEPKTTDEAKAAIVAAGYDGVVYENEREGAGDSWIAFRPEQIKSATGNDGSYDPANPDIRFSRGSSMLDEDGRPVFLGDGLRVEYPQPVERFEVIPDEGQELLSYAIMSAEGFDVLGHVVLLVKNGRPVSLIDLDVYPHGGKGRKNGVGRKTVEAIAAMADGSLNISNIVPEARGFWAKLGISEQNVEGAYDGQIQAGRRGAGQGLGRAAGSPAPGDAGADRGDDDGAEAGLSGQGEAGADDDLDGPQYSRADPRRQAFDDFMAGLRDRNSTSRFNLLHKSLSTQLHKAHVDADYARVFGIAQDYELDVARSASRPAEAAPDLLPSFDNLRSAWHRLVHGGQDEKRVRQVGDALWAGTLEGGPEPHTGKVWSDAELRGRFGLDDKQVKLYRQGRAAIDASLDESAAALAFQMVKGYAPGLREGFRREPGRAAALLDEQAELIEAGGADAVAALASARAVLERAEQLKAGGYAPLMRFGKYAVSVSNADGDLLHFEKFETELQAKTAALKLRREYPGSTVERSTMDTEGFKLFAGVDPESVALFAKQLEGQLDDDALQAWYRNAVSERSAFKRMIGPRKGMAGFSQEPRRVLASFITSNARLSARQFNMGDMAAEIQGMRERRVAGDVVDEAIKLKEYLDNPVEPFAGLKGLMFTWYLGGSVASAAVNATQPLMMTLPYLSQFGSASKHLAGAVKEAMSGKVADTELDKALARAADDGKVDPQQVHHLYHEGMSGLIDRLPAGQSLKDRAQGAMTLWGAMFGAVENFNRRLTFIAAYRMAKADKALGDPYAFAIKAIDDTQGIYNKSNRPNWARGTGAFGAVGAAAFTFKQYSIAYVELLFRMGRSGPQGRRAVAAMLGVLFLAAGAQGLPGVEDLEDLADAVAQRLGYRGNVRASMREAMGSTFGDMVMYGIGGALPADMQSRVGLGNLLPATGFFTPSNRDNKARELAELVGPAGGLAGQVGDFIDAKGAASAMATFAPLAIKNALMGLEMAETGEYRDTRGRKVTEVDGADALLKGVGFQPQSVSRVRRPEGMVRQDIARLRQVEADIVELRARAMVERDPELRREANEQLRAWRERNPDLRIVIADSQVAKRAKEMRRSSGDRLLSTAPKETRRLLADAME